MPEIQVCNCCRNRITDGSAVVTAVPASIQASSTDTSEILCEDCHTDLHTHCDRCEQPVRRSTTTIINNESIYCQPCVEANTCQCADCGRRSLADSLTTVLERQVCRSCVQNYYRCNGCRNYLSRNGSRNRQAGQTACDCGYQFCADCYQTRRCCRKASIADHSAELIIRGHNAITDYHPRFEWTFHADPTDRKAAPHFGVELEIEGDWPDEEENCSIYERKTSDYPLNKGAKLVGSLLHGVAFCSHDGSLENGMEIVTVPHKKEAFKQLNMQGLLKSLESAKCTSEVGGRCGMHIHIERIDWFREHKLFDAIRNNREYRRFYQQVTYNSDIYQMFYNLMWQDIFKLSRRNQKSMERYCGFKRDTGNKYVAVNLCPSKTVEVRIWRGTLNPYYFAAYMQFTFAVLDYLQCHSPVRILKAIKEHERFGTGTRFNIACKAVADSFHLWLKQQGEYAILKKRLGDLELFGFSKAKKKRKLKTKGKSRNVRNSGKTNRSEDRPRDCGTNVGS